MRVVIIVAASNLMVSLASGEEISLGDAQAPISFIEYGSLTCDGCISFHRNVLPRIKKHYIDTGSVRFVFRHFPTSEVAIHAAVAAQCAGEKYYEMLDELYSTVEKKAKSKDRKSYTRKILKSGKNKIAQKIGEESAELIIDYLNGSKKRTVEEASDLLYHLFILLYSKKINLTDIKKELQKRKNVRHK